MLAVSLDNLLFFLLIAVAALFQLLSTGLKKKGDKSESEETEESPTPNIPPPIRRVQGESDADRIRKFLEALGQPPSSTPPPPVAPRTEIPPRRLAPVQPPPVIPRGWGLPREERRRADVRRREAPAPEQPRHVKEIMPPPVPAPAAPAFEVHESLAIEVEEQPITKTPLAAYAVPKVFGVAKPADFKTDIAILLASKSSLREAIILREILGPPRGLHTLDLL
jgi:hypothetical protein